MSWWWLPAEGYTTEPPRDEDEPRRTTAPRQRRRDAKLTDAQVAEIRELGGRNRAGHPSLAEGFSYAELARRFKVSKALVSAVVKGRRYA